MKFIEESFFPFGNVDRILHLAIISRNEFHKRFVIPT
jgi:hypothetical protein